MWYYIYNITVVVDFTAVHATLQFSQLYHIYDPQLQKPKLSIHDIYITHKKWKRYAECAQMLVNVHISAIPVHRRTAALALLQVLQFDIVIVFAPYIYYSCLYIKG